MHTNATEEDPHEGAEDVNVPQEDAVEAEITANGSFDMRGPAGQQWSNDNKNKKSVVPTPESCGPETLKIRNGLELRRISHLFLRLLWIPPGSGGFLIDGLGCTGAVGKLSTRSIVLEGREVKRRLPILNYE